MRKVVASVMLVALAAPLLGGCSSWFGRAQAARSQPAVKAAPMSPHQAALMAGKDALREGQYAAAITDFRISRLDPALEAESLNGLAIAYSNIGRPDLSERYFRQAVAIAPDDRRFAANLARFEAISGKAPTGSAQASGQAPAQALAQAEAPPVPPAGIVHLGTALTAAPSPTGSVAVSSRAPDPSGPVRVVASAPSAPSATNPVQVRVQPRASGQAAASVQAPVAIPAPAMAAAVVSAPAPAALPVAARASAPMPAVMAARGADKAPASPASVAGAAAPAVVVARSPVVAGQVSVTVPAVVLSRRAANEVVIATARPRPVVAARSLQRTSAPASSAPRSRLALAERPTIVQALYRAERPGRAIGY